MRFTLAQLFYWVTAIAVTLPFVIVAVESLDLVQDPPLVKWGRMLAVFAPIVGGCYLFTYWGIFGKRNDSWITFGLLLGIAAGMVVGAKTTLGEWMIDHFNPSLPYQDFRTTFGVIGGCLIGAWFGALFGGIASGIFKRKMAT
jgi:hypothetical protein